jgi:predicted MFS family arabinose efflux permease
MAFVGAIAIGPALGGWIAERFGTQTAFTIDALTFLVPAVAVSFLSIPQSGQTQARNSLWRDWSNGFKQLKAVTELRNALLMVGAVALLIATLSTLGVVVVRERLGGGAGDFGWMMSIAGAGMLASAIANSLLGKLFKRQNLAIGGTLLGGAAMITLSLANSLPLVMAAGFLLGLGFVTVQVNVQTTLQKAPDELRGRMQGFAQAVMGSVTFMAAGLAGMLAAWISPTGVLLGSGLLATATGLAVLLFLRRPAHNTENQGGENENHQGNR